MINGKNIYDRERALEKLGGDLELLQEVEQVFASDCPQMMLKMKVALENKEAINLQRLAHTMKGSVSPFCAEQAYQSALRLEEIAKSGDLSQASQAFRNLQDEVRSLVQHFSN